MSQLRSSVSKGVLARWFLGLGLLGSFAASAGQQGAGDAPSRLEMASLNVGDRHEFSAPPVETEPRLEMKRNAGAFPVLARESKGDPLIVLRPSFDARLLQKRGNRAVLGALVFNNDATKGAQAFAPATELLPEWASFAPMGEPEDAANLSIVTASPRRAGPVESREFASLIDPANAGREETCLAEAVYFEARSEPEEGQAAVAQVVLNRVGSGRYPSTICGAVYQNRHRAFSCQFSFACEGKSLRVKDDKSWRTAVRIAGDVLNGRTFVQDVGGSTHYHANYVQPRWARSLRRMETIGAHTFYALRPGQS